MGNSSSTPQQTLSSPNAQAECPEYTALTQCYCSLVTCIQQSPSHIADHLIPYEVLGPEDLSFINNPRNDDHQKARRIVTVVHNQVKMDPQLFYKLVSTLEAAGTWTRVTVSELRRTYDSVSTSLSMSSAGHSMQQSLGNYNREQVSKTGVDSDSDRDSARSLYQVVEARPAISASIGLKKGTFDTKCMVRKFGGLIIKVIASIKEARIEVKALVTYLHQIEPFDAALTTARQSCLFFTPEVIHSMEAGDVDNIFRELKHYYSWFNFDLIEAIISVFCSDDKDVKKELSDYKVQMREYCKQRLCKIPKVFCEHGDRATSCVFKIDKEWRTMRLSELKTIEKNICRVLKLKNVALFLQAVSNGCVEVTFDIPVHVVDIVFPLSEDQVKALKEHGVQYCDKNKSVLHPGLQVIQNEESCKDKSVKNIPATEEAKSRLKQIVSPDDYHKLGLGRGVDVTDPDMWKNKTAYLVRRASEHNIISTQECEILESYEKEVSTFEKQRQKMWLSLDNPVASQVKIGMDEQSSRSFSSTKLIEGEKIETRTISFEFHFDDVPLYDNIDQAVIDAPDNFLHESDNNGFEEDLANWFLKRMEDRAKNLPEQDLKKDKNLNVDTEQSTIQKLVDKLKYDSDCQLTLLEDCKAFIKYLGITHYVSAIKLGACEYRVVASRLDKTKLGSSTSLAAGSLAKRGLSGFLEKRFSIKGKEAQRIGRVNFKKEVTSEAVIGFEVQPIYKLVRIQFVQMCLRKAIEEYIQFKEYKGPYLISSQIKNDPIFWKVIESSEDTQLLLVGTESAADASLFHIVQIGDPTYTSEFHIAYYTKEQLFRMCNERRPPIPHYLSIDTNLIGKNKGLLSLKVCTENKKAYFSLHSKVQSTFTCMMCTSTPIDLCSWLDGEQFYIKCSYHSIFKVDGYIAVEKENDGGNAYKVITVFSAVGKDPVKTGMLFRLHPKAIKDQENKAETTTTDAAEQASPPEPPSTEESTSPQSPPAESTEESSHTDIHPSVHAALSNQLLVPAVIIGTVGILAFSVYRALS